MTKMIFVKGIWQEEKEDNKKIIPYPIKAIEPLPEIVHKSISQRLSESMGDIAQITDNLKSKKK